MSITPLSTQPNSVTRPGTFNADTDTYHAELPALVTEINATVVTMSALAAGGAVSLQYTFSTTTTDADPGAGILRLSNATQNTATVIRADLLGNDTSDYSGVLALLDDSTSTNKGYITLRHATTPTKWLVFAVASLASPSGYKNVTVTCVASSAASPFANGDSILLDFSPTGDAGEPATLGANVATFLATPSIANLNSAVSDADLAILGANAFTGAQTLDTNVQVKLTAPTTDGHCTGTSTAAFVSGYTSSAIGDLVYLDSASKWQLCDANTAALYSGLLGIALAVAATDASLLVALPGSMVRATGFPTFTVGGVVYMSETAGAVTHTAPTTTDSATRVIGWGMQADTLYFLPSPDWITHI